MLKLRKMLSDTSRALRHQRNALNILITMLAWSVEFIGGLTVFLGSFIFGHGNSVITLTLQTLSMVFYFNVLPCTFLINEDGWKVAILESQWYIHLIKVFDSCLSNELKTRRSNKNDGVEAENSQIETISNEN